MVAGKKSSIIRIATGAVNRNGRATSGPSRMSKLHGLPGSVSRKARLHLSGILPHALHAAESSSAPKTVAEVAIGSAYDIGCRPMRHLGLPVWWPPANLSILSLCWVTNRVQLFRQVSRQLPDLCLFFDALSLFTASWPLAFACVGPALSWVVSCW